jgi:hypothetical protein
MIRECISCPWNAAGWTVSKLCVAWRVELCKLFQKCRRVTTKPRCSPANARPALPPIEISWGHSEAFNEFHACRATRQPLP